MQMLQGVMVKTQNDPTITAYPLRAELGESNTSEHVIGKHHGCGSKFLADFHYREEHQKTQGKKPQ